MLTKVNIIDNSGAIKGRIIKILRKSNKLNIGSLVLISILSNISNSKIRKGQLYKAIIVKDNSNNFGYNFLCKKSVILVKTKKNDLLPIGSRIKGFISVKLKNIKGTEKILSISKRTI